MRAINRLAAPDEIVRVSPNDKEFGVTVIITTNGETVTLEYTGNPPNMNRERSLADAGVDMWDGAVWNASTTINGVTADTTAFIDANVEALRLVSSGTTATMRVLQGYRGG